MIFEYYGATEIGIVVACDSDEWLAHEGTVGRLLADADIHVFDPCSASPTRTSARPSAHVDTDRSAGLTESAVRDHVGARLAGYKVPKLVVFDDDLPREETGKIFKRRIGERYWQDAGRTI